MSKFKIKSELKKGPFDMSTLHQKPSKTTAYWMFLNHFRKNNKKIEPINVFKEAAPIWRTLSKKNKMIHQRQADIYNETYDEKWLEKQTSFFSSYRFNQ